MLGECLCVCHLFGLCVPVCVCVNVWTMQPFSMLDPFTEEDAPDDHVIPTPLTLLSHLPRPLPPLLSLSLSSLSVAFSLSRALALLPHPPFPSLPFPHPPHPPTHPLKQTRMRATLPPSLYTRLAPFPLLSPCCRPGRMPLHFAGKSRTTSCNQGHVVRRKREKRRKMRSLLVPNKLSR